MVATLACRKNAFPIPGDAGCCEAAAGVPGIAAPMSIGSTGLFQQLQPDQLLDVCTLESSTCGGLDVLVRGVQE